MTTLQGEIRSETLMHELRGIVGDVPGHEQRIRPPLCQRLIDDGKLGRIFHYRANFLQDWTMPPQEADF